MKAIVLLNNAAGSLCNTTPELAVERIAQLFKDAGIDASIRLAPCDAFADHVRKAVAERIDRVVVGGGDGTVSAAAAALVGASVPLAILPLGTLNHFAKDLGLPLELAEAVRVIVEGHTTDVDVGEANGRIFLNNSSIGLYPDAVAGREELCHEWGRGKWSAMFQAAFAVFRRYPVLNLRLKVLDEDVRVSTPFVFVGNNAYAMNLFSLGSRPHLDRGELSLYVTRNVGRWGLVKLVLRAIVGRLEQSRDFALIAVKEVDIDSQRARLRVAFDGEVASVVPPVRYRLLPKALRVVVPASAT